MFLKDKKKTLADSDCSLWYNMERDWPDECSWTVESTDPIKFHCFSVTT